MEIAALLAKYVQVKDAVILAWLVMESAAHQPKPVSMVLAVT